METHLRALAQREGVASAYAAARDGIDAVLRDRGLRRTSPETTAESLLVGAHASAGLEGSTATLEQVRAGNGDELARDALRLSTQLLALAPLLTTAPLQALARMHVIVAGPRLLDDRLGRPRDAIAAERLRGVARMLADEDPAAPALLVAAVAHAEIAAAEPFPSHNGMVARALERLVLVARGVDAKSLIVPEAGHWRLRREYESNLRGYREGGERGVHAWLLYAPEAYSAAAEASPVASGRRRR